MSRYTHPLARLGFLALRVSAQDYREGVAGGNGPLRFSLACLGFSFLFRGVQRGYFSFRRERSEIMKADELLISPRALP